jgi:hypothetical protein
MQVRLVTSLKDRRNGGTLLLLALLAALCRGTGVLLPSAAHAASKEADGQDNYGEAEAEQAAKKKKNDDADAPTAVVVTTLAAGEVVVAQLEALEDEEEDRLWWRALGVCLFGTLLSVLPGANVLFTVGFTVAERVLYQVRLLATDD